MINSRRKLIRSVASNMAGFSLIELMVGMVIGLLVTLVITDVITKFEMQKRATTGGSDAQTNGSIAMYQVQRDAQSAGYGLPVYGEDYLAFNCPTTVLFDHDSIPATPSIGLSPVLITDGGAGGSDVVNIQMGDNMRGGAVMPMLAGSAGNVVRVDNNMGCDLGDVALAMAGTLTAPACAMSKVTVIDPVGTPNPTLTLGSALNVADGNQVSCLGNWNTVIYGITNNQLTRNGVPAVSGVVDLQAQYGISDKGDNNTITAWVNAAGGTWAVPTAANRNRIKAIRIAITARNGQIALGNVTNTCSSLTTVPATGLCAWDGTAASPAPQIDISATNADWRRYRYRVYETIIPIKNMVYSRQNAI